MHNTAASELLPPAKLSDPVERESLSPPAIKAFFNIAAKWAIGDADARALLGGVSDGMFDEMRKNPNQVLDTEQLMRISLLLGIFQDLNILFPEAQADAWTTLPNSSRIFRGETPLAYMIRGGLEAMWAIRRLLDSHAFT